MLRKYNVLITLVTFLISTTMIMPGFLSGAIAQSASVKISSMDPQIGHVGDVVQLVGELDTMNGLYTIKFDQKVVRNGTSVGTTVNTTFTVPNSTNGNHSVVLVDVARTNQSLPSTFKVATSYYVSAQPSRVVEGLYTTIKVGTHGAETNETYTLQIEVIDPLDRTWITNVPVITNEYGSGENSLEYPGDFPGADLDYLGNYSIAVNNTLATGRFTVGLTEKLEYRRSERVIIQGSGFDAEEIVSINVTTAGGPVEGYPKNLTASTEGVVTEFWTIPENASLGIYSVSLVNNLKPVPDIQNFTIIEIIVRCQTRNKFATTENLPDVTVEVYVDQTLLVSGTTNKTGWIDFRIDRGTYNFKASWRNETVGNSTEKVTGDISGEYLLEKEFYVECNLARIIITVNDEDELPIPFVNVVLTSNRTGPLELETSFKGVIETNAFTNANYTIQTYRYGHLFNTSYVENLTLSSWINITPPTYRMIIRALDSKGLPLHNVQVEVSEWESNLIKESDVTDISGNLSVYCTFGRYRIQVYNYSVELGRSVILNETIVDLIQDSLFLDIRCKISNLDLSALVVDYFGQPIPNAVLELERRFEQEYLSILESRTKSDGTALLPGIGGNYRISVYVMGRLFESQTVYLDKSKEVFFKIDRLAVVGGYPIETSQLATIISLGLLVVSLVLILMYRRFKSRKAYKGKE